MFRIIMILLVFLSTTLSYAGDTRPTVDQINRDIQQKGAQWVAGKNKFTKMSDAELAKMFPPTEREINPAPIQKSTQQSAKGLSAPTGTYPTSFDWRNVNGKNYMTAVKSQGGCGSCVFFAGTAAMEGLVKIKYDLPQWNLNLSEQYFQSCIPADARTCETGGQPQLDYFQLIDKGLVQEKYAPYTGLTKTCAQSFSGDLNTIGDYRLTSVISLPFTWDDVNKVAIAPTIEEYKQTLIENGPFVAIMWIYTDLFSYTSGIYSYTSGKPVTMHAVVVVGYDDVNQCLIVRNSWGDDWGESGYFRIAYSETLFYSKTRFSVEHYIMKGVYAYRNEPPLVPTASVTTPPPTITREHEWNFSVVAGDTVDYQYRLDGGAYGSWTPVATPIHLTNLPRGTHKLELLARSDLGVSQSVSTPTVYTWEVYDVPPDVQILNPPTNPSPYRAYSLKIGGDRVVQYAYQVDGGAWLGYWVTGVNIEVVGLSDGAHTLAVEGVDSLGNNSITSITWTVNTNPLKGWVFIPGSGVTNNRSATLYMGQSGGGTIYRYSIDGGPYSASTAIVEGAENTFTVNNLADGGHTVTLVVENAATHEVSTPVSVSWTVDATAPVAVLTGLPTNPTTERAINVTVGGGDVVSYQYTLDDSGLFSTRDVSEKIARTSLSFGEHTLRVVGKDALDNTQVTPTSYTWTIKSNPATLWVGAPNHNPTNERTMTLSVGQTGGGNVYRYSLDGSSYSTNYNFVNSAGSITVSGLSDGSHTVSVVAENTTTGEVTAPISVSWVVDTVAPVATLSNPPGDKTTELSALITVGGQDVVSYKYKLDGASYSSATDVATKIMLVNLSTGKHTLTVIGQDSVGNIQQTPTVYTWTVGSTPITKSVYPAAAIQLLLMGG